MGFRKTVLFILAILLTACSKDSVEQPDKTKNSLITFTISGFEEAPVITSNCRCEGTAVSIAEFKKIFAEEGFSIKKTAERLHITEKLSAQLARKLKLKK